MKNKIILFLLLILITGCSSQVIKEEQKQPINILSIDKNTREPKESHLILERLESETESEEPLNKMQYPGELIAERDTKEGIKELFNVTFSGLYKASCYNKEYYPQINIYALVQKTTTPQEFECEMLKIGDLEISHTGSIKDSKVILDVTSLNGVFHKTLLCMKWTMGIIYATYEDNYDTCYEGDWSRDTINNGNKIELTGDAYACNKTRIQFCEKIDKKTCFKTAEPVPEEIDANTCFQIGTIDINETKKIPIKMKTMDNLIDEELSVILLDQPPIKNGKIWQELAFLNSNDLGGKTHIYKVI